MNYKNVDGAHEHDEGGKLGCTPSKQPARKKSRNLTRSIKKKVRVALGKMTRRTLHHKDVRDRLQSVPSELLEHTHRSLMKIGIKSTLKKEKDLYIHNNEGLIVKNLLRQMKKRHGIVREYMLYKTHVFSNEVLKHLGHIEHTNDIEITRKILGEKYMRHVTHKKDWSVSNDLCDFVSETSKVARYSLHLPRLEKSFELHEHLQAKNDRTHTWNCVVASQVETFLVHVTCLMDKRKMNQTLLEEMQRYVSTVTRVRLSDPHFMHNSISLLFNEGHEIGELNNSYNSCATITMNSMDTKRSLQIDTAALTWYHKQNELDQDYIVETIMEKHMEDIETMYTDMKKESLFEYIKKDGNENHKLKSALEFLESLPNLVVKEIVVELILNS
jgi:hypothetical protein